MSHFDLNVLYDLSRSGLSLDVFDDALHILFPDPVGSPTATTTAFELVANHGAPRGIAVFIGQNLSWHYDIFTGNATVGGKVSEIKFESRNKTLMTWTFHPKLDLHQFQVAIEQHAANPNLFNQLMGGHDKWTGGPGADHFVFDVALNPANLDTITNFTPSKHDKIVLSETDFAGLGPHGALDGAHFNLNHPVGANPQIVYTRGNGFLYYEPHGNLGGHDHFATLSSHPLIHHSDFLVEA